MMNDRNKMSWCVNAFHAMSANNDGSTKMCCMIDESYTTMATQEGASDNDFFIGRKTVKENFDNPYAIKIRENLSNGVRDSACHRCWEEEDVGRKSKRMRDNERYLHEVEWGERAEYQGLAKFELNLGNNCNIKCRTCGPAISSTWMKETYDLDHARNKTYKEYALSMKPYHQQYDEDSPFWDDLKNNLSTIKQFDFYGGEPFLSKKMWEILSICVENGYSNEIELHYNTNGTNWPKEIELWKNFKNINLSFSIDGIDDIFEYMRYPAKWDVARNNMDNARELKAQGVNITNSWCVTLSTINIFYLPEIVEYHATYYNDFGIYLNLVHGPIHFNISKLSPRAKDAVLTKLNVLSDHPSVRYQMPGILGFIANGVYDDEIWENFKKTINKHDAYRQQDFTQTFKEYSRYV